MISVFIGPYDLRLSLGVPGGSNSSRQEFMEVVENICVIGKKLGKPVGHWRGSFMEADKAGNGIFVGFF